MGYGFHFPDVWGTPLEPVSKLVLVAISVHALRMDPGGRDTPDGECLFSVVELAFQASITPARTRRILRHLMREGWLQGEIPAADHDLGTYICRVRMPC